MKKNIIIIAALFFITLISCNSSSLGNSNNNAAPEQTSSSATIADAGFYCKLDGKEVSGKGTDQNINAAFRLTGDDKGKISFRLSNLDNIGEKFVFEVPGKIGTTTITATPTSSVAGYITNDAVNYVDDPLTVTITSINDTRVAGTFSGTYTLSGSGNGNSTQKIQVTDGKFDIPFSTSADWKKLYHAE
ncbi:MAG: hypothetical protein JST96_07415 [Bacteroidetes bacterium]|nr:hypothetical protein [Bacteroidota bacterium]